MNDYRNMTPCKRQKLKREKKRNVEEDGGSFNDSDRLKGDGNISRQRRGLEGEKNLTLWTEIR